MKLLVTYDVPDQSNGLQQRLARAIMEYGLIRVQYSIFFGEIHAPELKLLKTRVQTEAMGEKCDVCFFKFCEKCLQESKVLVVNGNESIEVSVLEGMEMLRGFREEALRKRKEKRKKTSRGKATKAKKKKKTKKTANTELRTRKYVRVA